MSGVPYALLLDEDFMNCLQDVLQQDQVYTVCSGLLQYSGKIPFPFEKS